MTTSQRSAFGDFVLERSQKRVLRRDGEMSLTPRLYDALALFVDHAGRLLEKDSLFQALWPGRVVEENNLSQVVFSLRRALGDDSHGSRFIETVPRRGFRFVAPVADLPAIDNRDTVEATWAPPPFARTGRDADQSPSIDDAAPPPQAEAAHPSKRLWLQMAAAGSIAAVVGGMGWWAWTHRGTAAGRSGPTLAVLPFKPLTADGRDELLEIGMVDSLTRRLSAASGLVVRSTGSSLRFAGPQQDPIKAARELGADWIVEGSLLRSGERLRTTARLVRASDGTTVWSDSFDTPLGGMLDVQMVISARVLQALSAARRSTTAQLPQGAANGGTRNSDAYQLYLAGTWRSQFLRREDLDRALQLFHQALALDPGFAMAWIAIARTHRLGLSIDTRPADVFGPAEAALRQAAALAPGLPEVHAGRGFTKFYYRFDWPAAERDFRAALAANPNAPVGHFGMAQLQLTLGRIGEGLAHLRQALELDPESPVFNFVAASYMLELGRLDEAQRRLDALLAQSSDSWPLYMLLGKLRLAEGRVDDGIAALRRAVAVSDGSSRPQAVLGVHLAAVGQGDETRQLLAALEARSRARFVPPNSIAALHAALGQAQPALDALSQAVAVRDTRMVFLKDDPHWQVLHGERRFAALVKQLGLDRFGPGVSRA